MTDHVTNDYVSECLSRDSALRNIVAQGRFPQKYYDCFGDRMMARPFFISEEEIRGSAEDLRRVFDILVSLPERLFDGDLGEYCAELDISKRHAALMQRMSDGRPTLFGRSDLYHDGTSLRLLEFNVGSQLGGIDQAQVLPSLMRMEAFREFADQHGLGYVHTGQQIAAALRMAAEPVTGGDEPVVALLEADGALKRQAPLMLSFEEMFRGCGLDIRLAEISQARCRDGKLYLDGTPIDVVLRYFSVNQLCQDPNGETAVEPVLRAHEEGGTVMLTRLDSFLYSSKGCLALLSDPYWQGALSSDEHALVDRFLPWTRRLIGGSTQAGDQAVDMMEYCRASRDRLLLKPANDYGGHGIVMGWQVSDADWKEALLSRRDRGYVVQERVVPRHEPVVESTTGRLEHWIAAWSTFLTPDGYAGSHIRALPASQNGVIGRGANAATRLTGVFHY
jgi:hypothetical protein